MWHNAQDAYLETRVLSADPIELVRLLYQASIGAVEDARRHLAAGEIAARSRSISKAHRIMVELAGALDHQRGAEISQRLAELYDYMERRLIEANLRQSDAPLREVRGLLATLAEAWEGIRPPATSAAPASYEAPAENRWARPLPQEPAAGYASHAWSL
jgi:flagellar protein FliS